MAGPALDFFRLSHLSDVAGEIDKVLFRAGILADAGKRAEAEAAWASAKSLLASLNAEMARLETERANAAVAEINAAYAGREAAP